MCDCNKLFGVDIDYSMLQCPPNVPDTTLFQDCNDDYDDDGMQVSISYYDCICLVTVLEWLIIFLIHWTIHIAQDGGMDFDNFDATVLGVCKDNQMAQYITSGGKTSENG